MMMKNEKRKFVLAAVFVALSLSWATPGLAHGKNKHQVKAKPKTVELNGKIDIEDEEEALLAGYVLNEGVLFLMSKTFTPPNKKLFKPWPIKPKPTHVDVWRNILASKGKAKKKKDTPIAVKVWKLFDQTKAGEFPLRMEGNLTTDTGGGAGGAGGENPHWSTKTNAPDINLVIYHGQGGPGVSEELEDFNGTGGGAFTVANKNDTDGDEKVDNGDDDGVLASEKGRDEVDLMQLDIRKPRRDTGGNVTLTVHSANASIWKESTKQTLILKGPGSVSYPTSDLANNEKTVWVELTEQSAELRDVKIDLKYKDAIDTVFATGIWSDKTGFKNSGDDLWGDAGNPLKTVFNNTYGGKFGIQYGESPVNVQYAMGMEFTVFPSGIGDEPGIVFDITRQIECKDWYVSNGNVEKWPPWEDFPKKDEIPNDEYSGSGTYNSDNDCTPENDHIYSIDGPGFPNSGDYEQAISRNNFFEFVRVKIHKGGFTPSHTIEQGSRCSDKIPWHVRIWAEEDGSQYKQRDNKPNDVAEGHEPLGEEPTPQELKYFF